ncbi:MAG: transposase [Pseudomonadota bacterium]
MTVERRKITYKLYPSAAQSAVLARLLEAHRLLYNAALEERISAWRCARKSISFEDQTQSLTQVRGLLPEDWAWVNCSAQQVTLRRLSKAFQAFFRRCKEGQTPGFPRFKSMSRMPGFGYKGHGDGWRFTPGDKGRHGTLRLQEVGHIRARGQSRFDLSCSKIKSCELLHEHGQWHLSLTVECTPQRAGGAKVGAADWGVNTLLTVVDDDGVSETANPRLSRSGMDRQVELQQRVSRAKRGSKGWKRACKALRCFKRRQARQRLDAQHKLSARIAAKYFAFGMEKLTVKNMTASAAGTVDEPGKNVQQKAGLNREILDTAPARLMALISYKVQETGGWFMEAPTRQLKPSQRCPACGHVHKKALSERTHACAQCGHTEPRDVASARIVYAWLHEQLKAKDTGQELPRWCSSTPETATIARQALGGR